MGKTASEWLKDPELFTTSGLALLLDEFGADCFAWDPLTIYMELKSTFGVEPSETLQDRLQAGASLLTSNLFFVSLETFSAICNALNFGSVVSDTFLPADLDDVLWGVTEARLLLGKDFEKDPFSHNIGRYVGLLLAQEGILTPPSVLGKMPEYPEGDVQRTNDLLLNDDLLYRVFWTSQQKEKESLEQTNSAKVKAMMGQLAQLPLGNGDAIFKMRLQEDLSK